MKEVLIYLSFCGKRFGLVLGFGLQGFGSVLDLFYVEGFGF